MFKSITLEVSLKPFYDTRSEAILQVAQGIFDQWRPLVKNRETVSVMLWTADGSEILDYAGRMEDSFSWCQFMGTANQPYWDGSDMALSIHQCKHDYRENPPAMTYGILRQIVSALKKAGTEALPGTKIRVGETFDIGPEFAVSDFKYRRHTEIISGGGLDSFGFVDATATLHGDNFAYAAYPQGIPEGTDFGTFLGRQASIFLPDMGFDFLWLSNGLGFSSNPWDVTGKVFDGKRFDPEKLARTRERVFAFWKLFRRACPDIPLETRGTNNSVGIDYASDGVPLGEIYAGDFNITPPPNSPWAALNDNYGLEIMGHMTRICQLPGRDFMFRYYIHDPWWMNTPWYDRYDGSPTDIYLPMAVNRLDEQGRPQSAAIFNILSIDNTRGQMPDCCVYEPLPHILKAEKDCADEPSPLVWVYPMEEFTAAHEEAWLSEMYYGDTFMAAAINHGFPLSTVISTDNFLKQNFGCFKKSILVAPAQPSEAVKARLETFMAAGGKVLAYGSAAMATYAPKGADFVDISGDPGDLRQALADFGWQISFDMQPGTPKPNALAIIRRDNGLIFSVYAPNTTTVTRIITPWGAPLLCGCDCQMENGAALYRFARSEHRECRIFVRQASGVVSCHEAAPVNALFRRRIRVKGLQDAEVIFFPEAYTDTCARFTRVLSDATPIPEEGWESFEDSTFGKGFRKNHVSGDLDCLLPFERP